MRRLFLKLFRRRRLQQDLETELAFHRAMSGEHHNPIPLGNEAVIKEQAFDLWRFNFIENLWRDLIYAGRGLRRSPGLVIGAMLDCAAVVGRFAAPPHPGGARRAAPRGPEDARPAAPADD